ncbi:MAG: 16S rRNA (guanine(527)-N(7))-methyltransferase RsmG [Bacteroidetes bacterium MED-G17]|nr:MAG: 16S rRNA (guanine(527)-N(7))-methyltransferase RsmG [Bacteroidetes bacterium MED-G17]
MEMEIIGRYLPNLTQSQKSKFISACALYSAWNEKINLISRKDIPHLETRHFLHSAAIANFADFKKDNKVLDIGTGGGFPGVVLAILYPDVHFHLVDSIGKKIKVVEDIKQKLDLENITASHGRVESLANEYHFAVTRAVAPLDVLVKWTKTNIKYKLYALKGGDLQGEIDTLSNKHPEIRVKSYKLKASFKESFFETKKLLEVVF